MLNRITPIYPEYIGLFPEAAELIAHCRGLIAGYKVPKAIHFVTELPLTASGKVRKRELVRRVEEGSLHPLPARFRPGSS